MKPFVMYITVFCILLFMCSPQISENTQTPKGLHGKLVFKDGSPVVSAVVKAYQNNSLAESETAGKGCIHSSDRLFTDSTITNSDGGYVFENLINGTYNVISMYSISQDIFSSIHFDLTHTTNTDVGTDTVQQTGYIKGQVNLHQEDKMGVTVYIPGTSFIAMTNKKGDFVISNVPPYPSYTIAFSYPGYVTAIDSNITVTSNDTCDIGISILTIDPNSQILPPNRIQISYDSSRQIISLAWEKVHHPSLAGYLIYRKDSLYTAMIPELISGASLITDTLFVDSNFLDVIDSTPIVLQYQMRSQDKSNNKSAFSDPVYIRILKLNRPMNPLPKDKETRIDHIVRLSWSYNTNDTNQIPTYTVYFDTVNPPANLLVKDIVDTSIQVSELLGNTMYYWYVSAFSMNYKISSNIWSFTTINNKIDWKLPIPEGIIGTSPAIGADGTIYIGTGSYTGNGEGKLYAINPDSTNKWEFDAEVFTNPTIGDDGTIYFCSRQSGVYAINPDGTQKWNIPLINDPSPDYSTPAIDNLGSIIIGHRYGLSSVSSDGNTNWQFTISGIMSHPSISSDGTIYCASAGMPSMVHAINPDGSSKWDYPFTDRKRASSPIIGGEGTIYITEKYVGAGGEDYLTALNPDGNLKWSIRISDSGYRDDGHNDIIVGKDEILYGTSGRKIFAIDSDGNNQWEYDTDPYVSLKLAQGKDGCIYVSLMSYGDLKIAALGQSGSVQWESILNDQILDSVNTDITISGDDGSIYICSGKSWSGTSSSLYKIITGCGGLADSPWPMFMHDAQHTGRQLNDKKWLLGIDF